MYRWSNIFTKNLMPTLHAIGQMIFKPRRKGRGEVRLPDRSPPELGESLFR